MQECVRDCNNWIVLTFTKIGSHDPFWSIIVVSSSIQRANSETQFRKFVQPRKVTARVIGFGIKFQHATIKFWIYAVEDFSKNAKSLDDNELLFTLELI